VRNQCPADTLPVVFAPNGERAKRDSVRLRAVRAHDFGIYVEDMPDDLAVSLGHKAKFPDNVWGILEQMNKIMLIHTPAPRIAKSLKRVVRKPQHSIIIDRRFRADCEVSGLHDVTFS
jgi:hypothetical protein